MSKNKQVVPTYRHQQAVEALLDSSSIPQASKKSGLATATFYRYLKDPKFMEMYNDARRDLTRSLHTRLAKHSHKAVETLTNVLDDESATNHTKITSAKAILELYLKAHEQAELNALSDRLSELENARVTNI